MASTVRTYDLDCVGCSRRFKAKSPRAKWCTPGCKKRAARVRVAEAAKVAVESEASRLVDRLREELEDADAADSFEGLLALELAARVVKAGPQGFSVLARELRVVRAAALGEELPSAGAGDGADEPALSVPDPALALVQSIEERRDSKLAEVGASR